MKRGRDESENDEEVFEEYQEITHLEKLLENTGEQLESSEVLKQCAQVSIDTSKKISSIYDILKDIIENQQKQRSDYLRVEKTLNLLTTKMEEQEEALVVQGQEIEDLRVKVDDLETKSKPKFDPETTIVAYRVPYTQTEDLNGKVKLMLEQGIGTAVEMKNVTRTPLYQGRAGLVKVQFNTREDKITVLKNKQNLRNCSGWMRNVYLRSSKSHAERLIEAN